MDISKYKNLGINDNSQPLKNVHRVDYSLIYYKAL